jgi:NAD-dependent SIR2 family protein deacetylase
VSVEALMDFCSGRRVCVLTGAGISTDSGIPDYRGPTTRHRPRNPIQYKPFVERAEVRQRYWARALLGWPRFRSTRPNPAHRALAALEAEGVVRGLITQNVDRLHGKAGSERVLELHGALAEVRCLGCRLLHDRDDVHRWMLERNPGFDAHTYTIAPDGDAELPAAAVVGFDVAPCPACGGVLKPNVVFFGENVPRPVVDRAWSMWEEADALLVVGSSLTVFSGYRFVKKAPERGLPVAILNLGPTRGDPLAALRVDAPVADVLPRLASAFGADRSAGASA